MHTVSIGKYKKKRQCRRRFKDNIEMDLQEIGWEDVDVDSINLAEDRATCCAVVDTAMEL